MVFGVRKFIENYNSHQRLFFFIPLSTDSKIKHNTAGFVLFTVGMVTRHCLKKVKIMIITKENNIFLYFCKKTNMKQIKISYLMYCILLVVVLLIGVGCHDNVRDAERVITAMQKDAIILPLDRMACMSNKTNILSKSKNEHKFNYVVYIDSSQCSPCAIEGLYAWNHLIDSLYTTNNIDFTFIVAPSPNQKKEILSSSKVSLLHANFFVDTAYVFKSLNTSIPSRDIRYHSFLLDSKNRIVLVGSIIKNPNIKQLFNKIINK